METDADIVLQLEQSGANSNFGRVRNEDLDDLVAFRNLDFDAARFQGDTGLADTDCCPGH